LKIIVIVGPTGSGKTDLSISLAKMYNAQIINADSVQIYKGVNIGSAKIRKKDMQGIKHYLLSIKSLDEEYTVYDYQKDAREILNQLIKDNINVIIVGGSGLYLNALLYDYKFEEENKKTDLFLEYSNKELKDKVDEIYKDNNIHINNRKRLVRFLNSYINNNKIIKNDENIKPLYDFICIGLFPSRDILYQKLDERVDKMFEDGLLQEARTLYNKGYKRLDSIIGYKELNKYFNDEITLEEAKLLIKKNTRHYSKRQMTWFKKYLPIKWIETNYEDFNITKNKVIEYIHKKNKTFK
jgi:tRNA dimethylallyltransferase